MKRARDQAGGPAAAGESQAQIHPGRHHGSEILVKGHPGLGFVG
jgi:hypothetical protein